MASIHGTGRTHIKCVAICKILVRVHGLQPWSCCCRYKCVLADREEISTAQRSINMDVGIAAVVAWQVSTPALLITHSAIGNRRHLGKVSGDLVAWFHGVLVF